jgi:hypothetical protein
VCNACTALVLYAIISSLFITHTIHYTWFNVAGEKQIEIDKRLLRDRASALRKELESVRTHRR